MRTKLLQRLRKPSQNKFWIGVMVLMLLGFGWVMFSNRNAQQAEANGWWNNAELRHLDAVLHALEDEDLGALDFIGSGIRNQDDLDRYVIQICESALDAGYLSEYGKSFNLLVLQQRKPEAVALFFENHDLTSKESKYLPLRVLHHSVSNQGKVVDTELIEEAKEWCARIPDTRTASLLLRFIGEEAQPPKDRYQFRARFVHLCKAFAIGGVFALCCVPFVLRRLWKGSEEKWSRLPALWSSWRLVAVALLLLLIGHALAAAPIWYQSEWARKMIRTGPGYAGFSMIQYFWMLIFPTAVMGTLFSPGIRTSLKFHGLVRSEIFSIRPILLVSGIVGIGVFFFAALIFASHLGAIIYDLRDSMNLTLIDFGWGGLFTNLVAGCILAPLCEEIIYRGFLFQGLRQKMNPWLAATLSSVVFALTHYYSVIGMVQIFFSGMIFCFLYSRCRSLWPVMLFHAAFNFILIVTSWYQFSIDFRMWGKVTDWVAP